MNEDVLVDAPYDPSHAPKSDLVVVRDLCEGVLADVFGLWDCYGQDWADPSAVVLRFESEDMMVWRDEGVIQCKEGSVDVHAACARAALPDALRGSMDPDACLCWVTDESYACLIGKENIDQELMEMLKANL